MGNLLQIEVPEFRDTYLNNLYSKRYREFRQNFYLLKRLPSKLVWKVVDKRNLIITLYKRKKVKYGAGWIVDTRGMLNSVRGYKKKKDAVVGMLDTLHHIGLI